MPKQDNPRRIEVFGQFSHVGGGALKGVEFEGGRGGAVAVAHHVGDDDAEIEGEEEEDLVAPAETEVRPAVDEKDGGTGRGGGGA